MPDGAVLITGGSGDFNTGAPIASVESYDPATGDWTEIAPLLAACVNHTASLLADATLLLFGGDPATGGSVERYDITQAVATAQSVDVADPVDGDRVNHTATTPADGRVLIAAGLGRSSAELFSLTSVAAPLPRKRPSPSSTSSSTLRPLSLSAKFPPASLCSPSLAPPASSSRRPSSPPPRTAAASTSFRRSASRTAASRPRSWAPRERDLRHRAVRPAPKPERPLRHLERETARHPQYPRSHPGVRGALGGHGSGRALRPGLASSG